MTTKPLWQSKTFWSDVVTLVVAGVALSDQYFGTNLLNNPAYTHALWVAGVMGIYGRVKTDTQISGVI